MVRLELLLGALLVINTSEGSLPSCDAQAEERFSQQYFNAIRQR